MAILLAEDDRALAKLILDFFQSAGLEVYTVHDGAAALAAAAEQSFDLMILDVTAAQHIRAVYGTGYRLG